MGLFSNGKKLNVGKLITLEQALKYQKDERYQAFIFPVEQTENGKMMCRIQQKTEVIAIDKQEEKRRKRNEKLAHIYDGGKYRGIDQNVSARQKQIQSRVDRGRTYNNWQNAKRYHPEDYQR